LRHGGSVAFISGSGVGIALLRLGQVEPEDKKKQPETGIHADEFVYFRRL
jgi:hypothetical protein